MLHQCQHMSKSNFHNIKHHSPIRPNVLYPIAVLWGAIIFIVFGYHVYDSFLFGPQTNFYLLPWSFATGLAIVAPSIYLIYTNQFDPFHPLVFPAWSYLFPAFAVGGLILAFGLSQPFFLVFVQDERYNLPLTLVYISIGYLSMAGGFYLPYSRRIGNSLGNKLPLWNWDTEKLLLPALFLLVLGFFNNILAFSAGIIGFQQVAAIGTFDGLLFLITLFWLQGSFLLWLCIFRTEKFLLHHYLIIGLLLATSLIKAAFQGNRGSLLSIFILVAFAFVMSKRKIELKHKVLAAGLVILAVSVGIIYGTTFRNIKQTSEQVPIEEYADVIFQTFNRTSDKDTLVIFKEGVSSLAERVESVSSVAVVVSNYEKLSTYEAGYGFDNNILKDSVNFLIPRFLWSDKVVATDSFSYGELYFDFGENSFTLTPFGDLLRNFGPWGIPLGMMVLGIFLRLMYSVLIEGYSFSYWRAVLYYMTLTSISYEGSYGLIIPYTIKVVFISVLGLLIVRFLMGKTNT